MEPIKTRWESMGINENQLNQCETMTTNGDQRESMRIHDNQWGSMGSMTTNKMNDNGIR